MRRLKQLIGRHPIRTLISALILMVLPSIVQPYWAMFSSEPMFPKLYQWLSGSVPVPSEIVVPWPGFITIPIGLLLVGLVFWALISRRAELTIVFGQQPPHVLVQQSRTHYRIAVENNGNAPAENVLIVLTKILPNPKSGMFRRDFPYRVSRAIASEAQNLEPCTINPDDREFFEPLQSWVSGGDHRLIVNRIDTKGPIDKWPGYIEMERDEHWRLHYRVTGSNFKPKDFSLSVSARGDTLGVSLDDAPSIENA